MLNDETETAGDAVIGGKPRSRDDDEYDDHPRARRQATVSDGGVFAGLPVWARVIALVGIPGTIAMFCVWIGSQMLPEIQKEQILLREAIQAANVLNQKISAQSEEQYRLLQKICSAQFKAEEEKQKCFDR